jgi:hypothetical protein
MNTEVGESLRLTTLKDAPKIMKIQPFLTGALILLGTAIEPLPKPAIAAPPKQAPCKLEQRITPEKQLKTISMDGFSFQIPKNYSATVESGTGDVKTRIMIHNPAQSKFLTCARQHRMLDAGIAIPPLWIEVLPMEDFLLLPDRTGGEFHRKSIKIAGKSGIIAKSRVPSGYPDEGDTRITVAVANGERNRIFIRYSTAESPFNSIDVDVLTEIISSLHFK